MNAAPGARNTRPAGNPTTGQTPSDDDITTTTTHRRQLCPVCGTPFQRIRRQRFCSPNCRKTAWARTRRPPDPGTPVPPPGQRRANTLYQCPSCDTIYHDQQWCDDCTQPCTRVGFGGICPHCQEPVALTDIIDPRILQTTQRTNLKRDRTTN